MNNLKGQLDLSPRGLRGMFYHTLTQGAGLFIPALSMYVPSDKPEEIYRGLGNVPQLRELGSGPMAKQLSAFEYKLKNKLYEATIELDWLDRFFDSTGQTSVRIRELAIRSNTHWASLLTDLVVAGDSTVCYDGNYFYYNAHNEGKSGVQSNDVTASDISALNVSTPNAPTPDEMASAIDGAISHFIGFKDDQGEPMNEDAMSFIVEVPLNLRSAAQAAVGKVILRTSTGNAVDNILTNSGFDIKVKVNPRLTNPSATFFVHRVDREIKPFIIQEALLPKFSSLAEGSEEEFKNNKHMFKVETIRAAGYMFWQFSIRATLS